ncbi:MAG: hypothetical protein ISR52_04130, partial [Rhodospirillales bacterium]|nr:hypothetical protein [Rhodospirillales bacterium]
MINSVDGTQAAETLGSETPFIHLDGVKKVFRSRGQEFIAISDATFDVREGELVSLV